MLTATFRAAISAQLSKSADQGVGSFPLALELLASLADGVDLGEVDKCFADRRPLLTGATEELDFGTGGGLVDVYGDPISGAVAEWVAIGLYAPPTNTTIVTFGAAAVEQFLAGFGAGTHTWKLSPGDLVMAFAPAGWPVVNNVSDKFKAANAAGATAEYASILVGRSA